MRFYCYAPEITSYLAHVKELDRAEECKKLMKFAAFREADMALLHKHRQTRVEVGLLLTMLLESRWGAGEKSSVVASLAWICRRCMHGQAENYRLETIHSCMVTYNIGKFRWGGSNYVGVHNG